MPETTRHASAGLARGDTDCIGDINPNRCGHRDFSARFTGKEKPVKEMNHEMNIKYVAMVNHSGCREFIKRGWRKIVFARPKDSDHEEWRLLAQDVPAKMRVDYPKDSIVVVLL